MPVNTATAEQVRGTGRRRYTTTAAPPSNRFHNRRNDIHYPRQPAYKCRATQTTARFDLAEDVSAWDIEGADRGNVPYVGSLSGVNISKRQCLLDTFADHGGYRTDHQFINHLPPLGLNLGVVWKDLNPRNGARPIKEVIESFITLTKGRTVILHSAKGDKARLDNSAAMCGLIIPWSTITVYDTQKYPDFWRLIKHKYQPGPGLKNLTAKLWPEMSLQTSGHNSLQDAIATMLLYLLILKLEGTEAPNAETAATIADALAIFLAELYPEDSSLSEDSTNVDALTGAVDNLTTSDEVEASGSANSTVKRMTTSRIESEDVWAEEKVSHSTSPCAKDVVRLTPQSQKAPAKLAVQAPASAAPKLSWAQMAAAKM